MSEPAFGKWHPIETAPKDYEWSIELPGQEDCGVGFATDDDTGQTAFLIWFDSPRPGLSKPQYWMPLPSAPSPASQPEAEHE